MTRMMSDVKNLGRVNVPGSGTISALTQFANSNFPVIGLTSLTPTSDQSVGCFGTNLIPGDPYYGYLYQLLLVGGVKTWGIATPASKIYGKLQLGQLDVNSVNADNIVANSVTSPKLAATAIDGMIITGAEFRTSATNPRIDIDSTNGLRAFNSSGACYYQVPTSGTMMIGNGMMTSSSIGNQFYGAVSPNTCDIIMSTSEYGGGAYIQLSYSGDYISFYSNAGSTHAYFNVAGLTLIGCTTGIVLPEGATVDGVDVSAHVTNQTTHGVTGNIVGTNMTNTLGASGIVDAKTNSAKLLVKNGPSFASAANPPTMTAGELLMCPCSGNGNYYFVFYDGTNYFYSLCHPNSLT